MKRTLRAVLCLFMAVSLFALSACGQKPLPEGLSQEGIEAQAKEALDALNAQDYAKLTGLYAEELQANIPAESWAETFDPLFDTLGPFEEYKSIKVGGAEQEGVLYAVAVAKCKYQNGSKTYTLTYDAAGQLIGLFITA